VRPTRPRAASNGVVNRLPLPAAGGRASALAALERIRPDRYARSRNFLDGAVTRLSPYLRHGLLTLAEARDAALRRTARPDVEKFVQELAWRDYFVRTYRALGDAVWDDVEPYKTGRAARSYAEALPEDVRDAATGAACIDGFVRELEATGYLHNHARMWFASYLVHWRGVAWQVGARFFLARLLDGDPASNNLSWQWVASTFSHKPYVFNRENLERYSRGVYCRSCPLARGGCPFDKTYEALDAELFPNGQHARDTAEPRDLRVAGDPPLARPVVPANAIVWQHEESLAPTDAARALASDAPAIFVWDDEARRRDPWSAARIAFVEASLAELELARVARGDAVAEIGAFARERGATAIVVTAPIDPRLRAIVRALRPTFDVVVVEGPRFVTLERDVDLQRFSRYWSRAERTAFTPTVAAS
jgi:deoxyribodipyrimidine photo-lyase